MEEVKTRQDGWANVYTNQGITGKDKQLGNSFAAPLMLSEVILDDAYRGDGFTRRIVDLPTKAMVKNWFEVKGDTDGDVVKYLAKRGLKAATLKALQLSRVFGGAVMVMGINDGGTLETELREDAIKEIEFFRVYDRWRVDSTSADLYSDPQAKKYGKPRVYNVSPISGLPFRVHESRVLVFDGMEVSDRARADNMGWGDSYIQHVWTQLANLGGVYFSAKNVIDDFIQIIMQVDNLAELIAAGREAEIKKRLEILDMGRHTINTMLLDTKEKFEKHANTVTGLADLIDRFAGALAGVTGIPVTLLMGRSPAGLNATGESDMRNWYDNVKQDQEATLLDPMTRVVGLAMKSKAGPTKGAEIKDWGISFNSLWEPSMKETVEARKLQADADALYVINQVLTPEEVAASRFGGGEYSFETTIDLKARTEPEEPDDDEPPAV